MNNTYIDDTKICAYCSSCFVSTRKNKIYCSKKCSDLASKKRRGIKCNLSREPYKKICDVCGKEFETFRDADKRCSQECIRIGKNRKPGNYHGIKKNCAICGDLFIAFKDDRRTCGKEECKKKYRYERHLIRLKRDRERKKIERLWKNAYRMEERTCEICGSLFYCMDVEVNKTCSSECSNILKSKKQKKHHDKRLEKYNISNDKIDLKVLYKRDRGICYLCGEKCDWNDHKWKNGIHYTGNYYPSRDHVIPLALGGEHTWENVRLAHMKCNMEKGVTTFDYTKEMAVEDARKYAINRSQNKKKTAQYTLDGELVKIWDSTAQIKRDLGLNDKHIQNVCRRTKSRTGNAYGYHWEYVVEHEDIKLKV